MRLSLLVIVLAACGNKGTGSSGTSHGSAPGFAPPNPPTTGSATTEAAPPLPVPSYPFEVAPPKDKIVALSGDKASTCVVRESGAVDCWGFVDDNQAVHRLTEITDAVAVRVDGDRRCFLTRTNTVRCKEGDGKLEEVPGLRDAVELATEHAECARVTKGKLACWSTNEGKPSRAELVRGPKDVVFAATDELDCAATASGQLWCKANGTWVQIRGVDKVRAIALGGGGGYDRDVYARACAIVGSGELRCFSLAWTSGGRAKIDLGAADAVPLAELGSAGPVTAIQFDMDKLVVLAGGKVTLLSSEREDGNRAVTVPVLVDAVAITPRCALRAQGSVVCWGNNDYGVTGLPYRRQAETPIPVIGIADVVSISRTMTGTWAVTGDGSLYHWGDGKTVPERLAIAKDLVTLASHPNWDAAPCAIRRDRGVTCFVHHGYAMVKTWPPTTSDPKVANVVELTATLGDHIARLADGTAVRWGGLNATPTPIPKLANAAQVVGEMQLSCARDVAGKVTCREYVCTRDAARDLHCHDGDPVAIPLDGVVELAVTRVTACARRDNGEVMCWNGSNSAKLGQITTQFPAPQPVAGIRDAVMLRATDGGFCVSRRDGRLTCWGDRMTKLFDALPPGTLDRPFVGSWRGGCIIGADRRPRCWGDNEHGQLGDGSVVSLESPAAVPGL